MKITAHEFKGGARVWVEDGDKKTSSVILAPGRYDFGVAGRDETIVVVRGEGKIRYRPVKWNPSGDDAETRGAFIPRGERIIIEVEGNTPMHYLCDFGPKIFHEIFSRTLEQENFSEATIAVLNAARITTIGELVQCRFGSYAILVE